MVRGFYNLGSSMLTQSRMLSAISNNIANVNTNGFKKDKVLSSTFNEMLVNRIDGKYTELDNVSMLRTADESMTIHSQGNLKDSTRTLDFAIQDAGFFGIQTADGVVYTRDGSFNLDNEGYIVLRDVGRVLGQNGQPIKVNTDNFKSDKLGNIIVNNQIVGKIATYDFADYATIRKFGEAMFVPVDNAPAVLNNNQQNILWKTTELSNVDMSEEMTSAIATQRNLQASSQALKMYDVVMSKAVSEIGRTR